MMVGGKSRRRKPRRGSDDDFDLLSEFGGIDAADGYGSIPPMRDPPDRAWGGVVAVALAFALIFALGRAWWGGSVALRVLIHPPGATALCRDRSYSYARSRSGACSHHDGVLAWIAPDTPATSTPEVAGFERP